MHSKVLGISLLFASGVLAQVIDRDPLSYVPVPDGVYAPETNSSTLLDLIKSRSDLSDLADVIAECAGFTQAFDTPTSWQYTFFAPSNTAFNNTGSYFETHAKSLKGKWWLGNLIHHHYIPNTVLKLSAFNQTYQRLQSSTYLYIGAQMKDGHLMLNGASLVTEGDIDVPNGILHIVDHLIDPAAQVFEADVGQISQEFIPGSCSNPNLAYC